MWSQPFSQMTAHEDNYREKKEVGASGEGEHAKINKIIKIFLNSATFR